MLISGVRYLTEFKTYNAYIPIANLTLTSLDESSDYATHIANLIRFEVEIKFKKTIDVKVISVSDTEFILDVELCREVTAWIVAELRLNSCMTQYAVAKKTCGSNVNISRIEHAERLPSLETLEGIANACGFALELTLKKLPSFTEKPVAKAG